MIWFIFSINRTKWPRLKFYQGNLPSRPYKLNFSQAQSCQHQMLSGYSWVSPSQSFSSPTSNQRRHSASERKPKFSFLCWKIGIRESMILQTVQWTPEQSSCWWSLFIHLCAGLRSWPRRKCRNNWAFSITGLQTKPRAIRCLCGQRCQQKSVRTNTTMWWKHSKLTQQHCNLHFIRSID